MELCAFCGNRLPADARFCGNCGRTRQLENGQETHPGDQPTLRLGQAQDENAATVSANWRADAFLNTPTRPLAPPQSDGPMTLAEDESELSKQVSLDVPLPAIRENPQASGHIPTIQGTPQMSHMSTIPGTPSTAGSTPPGTDAGHAVRESLLRRSTGHATQPVHVPGKEISHGAPAHASGTEASHDTSTHLPERERHTKHKDRKNHTEHTKHGRHTKHARHARHAATTKIAGVITAKWVAVVISAVVAIVVVVSTLLISVAQSNPPTLTIIGIPLPGSSVTIHGSNFPPRSQIHLSLDGVRLAQAAPAPVSASSSAFEASLGVVGANLLQRREQAVMPANGIIVRDDGSFDQPIHLALQWSSGSKHTLNVYGQDGKRIIGMALTIGPVVPTPTLIAAATATATTTPTPTPAGITPTPTPTPIVASAATVTITPANQQVNNTFTITGVTGTPGPQQVQARVLSATTQTFSTTVPATGQGTIPGTSARGTVYINNTSSTPITITAGTVYPCVPNDVQCPAPVSSLHLIIDQTVTLLTYPNPSSASGIPAHIQEVGSIGNFAVRSFAYSANNIFLDNDSAFTGGTDSQSYLYVQQSDVDNAANSLIAANQPNAQQMLQGQMQPNEQFAGTPQCTPNISANPPVGTHASTVTVNVYFTCTGEVYDNSGALALAGQLLTQQAASNPGSGFALVGQIIATLKNASLNGQTVTLKVVAKGLWVYQVSAGQQQTWASSIVGLTSQAAQSLLAGQQGVAQVTIQLTGANAQVLPTNPGKITMVVQPVQGF